MDLEIINISGRGDASKEFVYIKVIRDCNLKFYAIIDTTYVDKTHISNEHRHFYWFPNKDVKAGEYVSLRTSTGKRETIKNAHGQIVHRFHWGLKSAVWNDTGDAAVLMRMRGWRTTKVK